MKAKGYIIFLAGFGGNELYYRDPSKRYWVERDAIRGDALWPTLLAGNGTDPGGPLDAGEGHEGKDLLPGMSVAGTSELYQLHKPLLDKLDSFDDYGLDVFPYDFRKSLILAAAEVVQRVRYYFRFGDRVSIVAHSTGGLVARLVWRTLKKAGEQEAIRRIITLGTPHYGSYTAALLFLGFHPVIQQIVIARRVWNNLPNSIKMSDSDARNIVASWPAAYELLPFVPAQEKENDPDRAKIYDHTFWSAPVRQTWLNHAKDVFQPLLADPDSFPPNQVLTTVAGRAYSTPIRLRKDLRRIGGAISFNKKMDGDSVVTQESALIEESEKHVVSAQHHALVSAPVVVDNIKEWLDDERVFQAPMPAAKIEPNPPAPPVPPPPLAAKEIPNEPARYLNAGDP